MWEICENIRPSGKDQRSTTSVQKLGLAPGTATSPQSDLMPEVLPQNAPKCIKITHIHIKHHQATYTVSYLYIYIIIYIHHYTSLYTPRSLYVVSTSYTGSDNGDFNFALPFTAHSGFCSKSQAFGTGMKNDESMALGDCVMNCVMTLRHITPLRHMVPALQLPPASPG